MTEHTQYMPGLILSTIHVHILYMYSLNTYDVGIISIPFYRMRQAWHRELK